MQLAVIHIIWSETKQYALVWPCKTWSFLELY